MEARAGRTEWVGERGVAIDEEELGELLLILTGSTLLRLRVDESGDGDDDDITVALGDGSAVSEGGAPLTASIAVGGSKTKFEASNPGCIL